MTGSCLVAKLIVERKGLQESYKAADETPLTEAQQAMLAAQDDLSSKSEEAAQLAAKIARLERALRQLM